MRRRTQQAEGVREYLAGKARESVEGWATIAPPDDMPGAGRLAQLEAGEPVEVQAWELGPHRRGFRPTDTVRVDGDGSMHRL